MVDQPSSLYGVVGQPLTQDYLARQLPIFQHKVPNTQLKLQFPTNAPPNLPLPPLYPGETIRLQEHQVVCTDTFEEPAVGAIYVSNYRFIFYGNCISDPDSMDALHDTNWKTTQLKKESTEAAPSPIPFAKSAANKFKPFSSTRPEPSFKSFLVGSGEGERSQDSAGRESPPPSQHAAEPLVVGSTTRSSTMTRVSRHTNRLKSGFRKIGSLRLSPRNRPKHVSARSLPVDLTDGHKSPDGKQPSEELMREEADHKVKRKDIMLKYHQDTVSLDSVSVSSTSEFSAAGTDDRSTCSPVGDGESSCSGPLDILRGEQLCLNGVDRGLGVSDPLSYGCLGDVSLEVSDSSYQTVDSGISVIGGKGSSVGPLLGKGSSPCGTGKGSSDTQTLIGVKQVKSAENHSEVDNEPSSYSEKEADLLGVSAELVKSSDSLCRLTESEGTSTLRSVASSGCSTLNKSVSSSGCDTLKAEDTPPPVGNGAELPVQALARLSNGDTESSIPNRTIITNAEPTANGRCEEVRDSDLSPSWGVAAPSQGIGNGNGTDHSHFEGNVKLVNHVHANVQLFGNSDLPTDVGGVATDLCVHRGVNRKRSKSSSPYVRKKPKPLPRKSLQAKQVLSDEARNDLFLSSLPADFKPVPLPRGDVFHKSGTPPTEQGALEFGAPQCNSSSNISTPQKMAVSNSSTPKVPSPSPPTTTATTPRHEYSSSSSTPSHAPPNPPSSSQLGASDRSPPHCESSTPSSPLYASSTSNMSSDAESNTGARQPDVTPDPIPPPRRRRRSKLGSQSSGKESVQSGVDVLPMSPEEPPNNEDRLPRSHDHSDKSCDQHDGGGGVTNTRANHGSLLLGSTTSSKSHDLDDSGSSRSHDLASEEDILTSPLLEETNDVFVSDATPTLPSHLTTYGERNTHDSIESSRTSRTSLTVFPDSSGSSVISGATLRPYSFISPGDSSHQFSFTMSSERAGDSLSSGGHTMPRSVAGQTWTPRGQARASVKTIVPASTRYSLCVSFPLRSIHSVRKIASVTLKEHSLKLPEGILLLSRNFQSMRLHIHPHNTYDADGLRELMERKFLAEKPLYELFAFQYRAAIRHPNPTFLHNRSLPNYFHLSAEISRLGLQGSMLWSVTRVLTNHPELCPSYPTHVIVPTCTGDLDYIRGAKQYHEGRFPTLTWYKQSTGAALIRAASTRDERGQSGMQMDEALLQSISGSKLDPAGPPMIVHVYADKPESGLNERNAEQVRTYYYHNCKFVYSTNTPTYRSVRHSFNKLQAMLENSLSDEDYLIALDTTRWLPRVGELLSTAHSICHSLLTEGAHVLVCYESGWDRTTQLVSLAQLLMDPYYRTMAGFQVLVQKEWVWFGHPFHLRHSRSGKSKDDGPIFLQWTDCVWQVMQQSPSAFEFNEKFLMCMVEHSYSGMFGTFITNSEGERKQYFSEKGHEHMSVSSHTVSFWTWVNMRNAAGQTFYNHLYDPNIYTGILEPKSTVSCLKLWTSHYCRCKPQENVYQSSVLQTQLEELLKAKKKLEALYAQLAPAESGEVSAGLPPPVGPRDELLVTSGKALTDSLSVHRGERPIPPPKPAAKSYKYESLKEFLIKEGYDPSICMHLELGATTCQGNLYKLGAVRKNWLQRWFVLDFSCQYFAYFENQQAYSNKETPKGVIRLSDISRVFQEVKKKDHLMKNIFQLETPHRTYQMQAPTILTMYIWIACLELPVSALKLGSS